MSTKRILELFAKGALSTGKVVMEILLTIVDTAPLPFETPYAHIRRIRSDVSPRYYRQTVRRLEQRRDVERSVREGEVFLRLTEKGKLRALLGLLYVEVHRKEKWDGKWRLLIFDIPELNRKQRELLRRCVRSIGFLKLQESVYIYPYEISVHCVEFLGLSGLQRFIRILRVDKLDDDGDLRHHFKLKI